MAVSHNPKTDRWDVQAWYRTHDGSRKKKHKRGFRTKAEARRWERDFLLRAEGSPSMLFADFAQIYLSDARPQLKLNTYLTKEHIVRTKLVPFFGGMRLDEIQGVDIMRWQNELRTAANPKTGEHYAPSYLRTVRNQCSHPCSTTPSDTTASGRAPSRRQAGAQRSTSRKCGSG